MARRIYWIHTLTPTHPGIGRGVGYVDLPVDRDRVTGWPIIRASSFKGVLADHFGATDEKRQQDPLLAAAFGLSASEDIANAGSLIMTDAQLVCLPIRSFRGTFAWVTSSLCLERLARLLHLAGLEDVPTVPRGANEEQALHTSKSALIHNGTILLEDFDLSAKSSDEVEQWAKALSKWVFPGELDWQKAFLSRFVVVPNDLFDFLTETGTDVHTRVRIDKDLGTVKSGALWAEECLPAETILAGFIQCDRIFTRNGSANGKITPEQIVEKYVTKTLTLQIGGNATVGQGMVRCVFTEVKVKTS